MIEEMSQFSNNQSEGLMLSLRMLRAHRRASSKRKGDGVSSGCRIMWRLDRSGQTGGQRQDPGDNKYQAGGQGCRDGGGGRNEAVR